ncbi:hypothetical protein BV898_09133 [Hypsibius exemplaris]|uniref:RRM domain-containing protein n=1 Tax=Hypsibius exemplaris TaxID=2072580 RepID=A0A1W0WNP6_HYPEX|nr:hypothetical protein BV898_09133 [Hypsibius exemplaris]
MTTLDSPTHVMPPTRACPVYSYPMPPLTSSPRSSDGLSTSPGSNHYNAGSLQGDHLPEKVFVGGLAEKTTEQDLRDIFQALVPVKTVKIITDKSLTAKNGEPRRYAFIEFNSVEDAKTVLAFYSPDNNSGEGQTIELHGRRLNIGSAYKKTPTFGRTFGPTIPQMMDPYQMYGNPYAAAAAAAFMAPKSPLPPGLTSPFYMPYYGAAAQSPYQMYQPQMAPQSPSLPRHNGYNGGPLSPGAGSPTSSYSVTPHMAYQLAQSMLQAHMSMGGNGGSGQVTGGASPDLDCSYQLNSSSNSGSSRNGGSDRPAERFQYGPQSPLTQLPSGHSEQRERNGRSFSIPQPVRLPGGPPPSPYMAPPTSPYGGGPASMTDNGGSYLPSPGMVRHQYAQH